MTNPTGRSFLSYRRTRLQEAELLIKTQHELGIPTWQDIHDLDEGHTETEIRNALNDPDTANAILWLTPEVKDSDVIQRVEAPLILQRHDKDDGFFIIPVAAGGLDYDGAAAIGSSLLGKLGITAFKHWHIKKVASDPIQYDDAVQIAKRVLKRRIKAIQQLLSPNEPLRIALYNRQPAPFRPGMALSIDWSHCFKNKEATPETWTNHLLPALKVIAETLNTYAHGRPIEAQHGPCTIPAALALGTAFLAPKSMAISWMQKTAGHPDQPWSLNSGRTPSGFIAHIHREDPSGDALAVLVSVADDVRPAFEASRGALPAFRAITTISKPDGNIHTLTESGHAVDVAYTVVEAIRSARKDYPFSGPIHFFMAVPVGLAMLIGQLLNTLGPVQTYEHIPSGGIGHYRPAALLEPSL